MAVAEKKLLITKSCEQLRRVLEIESDALRQMMNDIGEPHEKALDLLAAAKGRIIISGVGKSGHIGCKIAATFASTGAPAQFVHPTEASHGDLGMITQDDVCLVISNSGETRELVDLITYTRRFAIPLIAITSRRKSTLDVEADVTLLLPDAPEACAIGVAPTTSTTATLALGDALAVALMHRRGFRREDFQVFHPGGKLGAQLVRVEALMHSGDAIPKVAPSTAMGDVLLEMTSKGFGMAAVMEGDKLLGVVTDGDLRRNLVGLMERDAAEIATRSPKTVPCEMLASEALHIMNTTQISALFVLDAQETVVGVLHIHDLLRAGVA
jgi:arabinose-5-phosphate isomerase